MKEIPGKGPGTIGTLERSKLKGILFSVLAKDNWPFSARHNRLNAKRRRLISRYTNASRSYGKSDRDLDLPEAAGRRAEGRDRGMRRRRSLNDWRGGGGGRDHAGQGAAK
jgi:hypothetical protein